MTTMTGPNCMVMCNLIRTHAHTNTQKKQYTDTNVDETGKGGGNINKRELWYTPHQESGSGDENGGGPLPGTDFTNPRVIKLSSRPACPPFRGSRIPIPGKGCFGDFPGDEIVESPPTPPALFGERLVENGEDSDVRGEKPRQESVDPSGVYPGYLESRMEADREAQGAQGLNISCRYSM